MLSSGDDVLGGQAARGDPWRRPWLEKASRGKATGVSHVQGLGRLPALPVALSMTRKLSLEVMSSGWLDKEEPPCPPPPKTGQSWSLECFNACLPLSKRALTCMMPTSPV